MNIKIARSISEVVIQTAIELTSMYVKTPSKEFYNANIAIIFYIEKERSTKCRAFSMQLTDSNAGQSLISKLVRPL